MDIIDEVTIYQDRDGEWRWRRTASNGRVLADSGEGYVNEAHCREMAQRVNSPVEPVQISFSTIRNV